MLGRGGGLGGEEHNFHFVGKTQTPNKHKQHRNYHKYQISRRETTAAASVTFTAKTPEPKNKQTSDNSRRSAAVCIPAQ